MAKTSSISPKKQQDQLTDQLYLAVQTNNVAAAARLIEQGADAKWSHTCRFDKGDTKPNESLLSIALNNKNTDMMRLLIKHGANTKFRTIAGIVQTNDNEIIVQYESLLRQAAKIDDPVFAEILIKNGAPINDEEAEGANGTALFDAVAQGCLKTAALLLENGAHPGACALPTREFMNGRFNMRQIPLGEAVRRGDYDMTCLLLHYGAAQYINDDIRTTLIHLAAEGTNKPLEAMLLETPQDLNEAFQLIQFRNPDWARHLINKGAQIGFPVDIGKCQEEYFMGLQQVPVKVALTSPLARAIKAQKYDIARLMIKKGTNLNVDDLIHLLKTKNFDTFSKVTRGNTPLLKHHGHLFLKTVHRLIHPPYERRPDKKAALFYKSLSRKITLLNKKEVQHPLSRNTVQQKRLKVRE